MKGMKLFKTQVGAWFITIIMIIAAIGIGQAKNTPHDPQPNGTYPSSASDSYVWDDAGVLSSRTKRLLDERNDRLLNDCDAIIGVATCNYGRSDLGDHALSLADEMGLGSHDMFVVLDIKGANYWLLAGTDPARYLSGGDCSDYAWSYMENYFVKGDYDSAVLSLTEALENWYYANF